MQNLGESVFYRAKVHSISARKCGGFLGAVLAVKLHIIVLMQIACSTP